MQSHGTPQCTTSRNIEISEGNPRQLSQNPQEVELRQGKLLFYYRELWMSAKLVEQELHWFPLESRWQQFRLPSPCRESSIFHSLPVSTQPSPQERGLPSDTSFPLRAKVSFQEGLFPSLCPLLLL